MKAALHESVVPAFPIVAKERHTKLWWIVGGAVGMGGAVLILTLGFLRGVEGAAVPDVSLDIYVQHGLTLRPARSGDSVVRGDALELTYSSLEPRFITVVSRSADGATRLLFPEDGVATRLQAGDNTPLLHGPLWVDRGGVDTFYAIFCAQPLAVEPILAALRDGALPGLPANCDFDTVRLKKNL